MQQSLFIFADAKRYVIDRWQESPSIKWRCRFWDSEKVQHTRRLNPPERWSMICCQVVLDSSSWLTCFVSTWLYVGDLPTRGRIWASRVLLFWLQCIVWRSKLVLVVLVMDSHASDMGSHEKSCETSCKQATQRLTRHLLLSSLFLSSLSLLVFWTILVAFLYIPAYSTFLYPPILSIYFLKSLYREVWGLAFWLHHQTFVHEFGSTHWTAHSSPKHSIPIYLYSMSESVRHARE